eukprot:NODE_1321_length_459_cov_5.006024_g1311_i0.p2 GENE.NODE_1321_length_459_cov_5.006024_g1311_i0~~NODE_1321_length_459_cov_5.006024_g1311_i0.p2  ORF type:complete len:56 (+),score=9.15 NODE_1321_length_459_cov_5.006024_g1311_i0:154-321(+)
MNHEHMGIIQLPPWVCIFAFFIQMAKLKINIYHSGPIAREIQVAHQPIPEGDTFE